jgi:nucleoside-diphosphate-sugar epimerase
MKILVTGGAGYKGVLLVEQLLDKGHEVVLLDNFMYGYAPVLHLVSREKLTLRQLDVRNIGPADVSPFDVVFHLAGISGVPACAANPHSAEVINVEATRRLVGLLGKSQVLVNASTTSFYGASGVAFDETMAVEPISIYGRTKYQAEVIVQQHPGAISLRFATVFGVSPKMRDDLLVNDFVYKALHDKLIILFAANSKRTFVHVRDAVEAYMFCLDHLGEMSGQVYNVGSEELNFSKQEIASAVCRQVKCEVAHSSMPSEDRRNFEVCFRKLKALGYRTRRSLEYGVSELAKLYGFYTFSRPFNII